MLSSFQHPRSCIFFSLEHVTLSSPCFYAPVPSRACAQTRMHAHTDKAARDKHGLKPRWPSVRQKHTLRLKSLLYPRQTKRRLHLRTVPTIRPWPGPFLSPVPPPSPSCSHPDCVLSAWGSEGGEVRSLCSHVSMLVRSVRLALFTIDVQRDWPAAFDAATPHSDMNEHGCRGTPAPLCVCRFTVNARGVCLFWMSWKFGVKPEIFCESGQNRIFCLCLTVLNFSRSGRGRFNFSP